MCHHLIELARNEFRQAISICEHDTLHLLNQHTTIVMTRQTFYELNDFLQSCCLNKDHGEFNFKVTDDNYVEFWIGKGGFRMFPAELIALATLVEKTVKRLKQMPLQELTSQLSQEQAFKSSGSDFSKN